MVVLAVSISWCAGQSVGSAFTAYTSLDGTFQFSYPPDLVLCGKDPKQPELWLPIDSCSAVIPVCYARSDEPNDVLACVAYPADSMKGTNFEAGAFSVSRLAGVNSEAECRQFEGSPEPTDMPHVATINGTKYFSVVADGVAAGSSAESHTYRTFHRKHCYELKTSISLINPGYADPGVYKPFDIKKVQGKLDQALKTSPCGERGR
jgi:hypothetical protein